MTNFLATCPGLAGEIARYINLTLTSEQPEIALCAAFTFMGALYSERVNIICGTQTTEPCLYGFVVVDSAVGKTSAQNTIKEIINQARIESAALTAKPEFTMGIPASDAGLYAALCKHPRRLLIWDEMGKAIKAMANSTNSYQDQILTAIMELYSRPGLPVKGREYSKEERKDTKGAYLSIFGASTPNRFYNSLTEDFIYDGFLSRWLLFCQADQTIFKEPVKNYFQLQDIVNQVRQIDTWMPLHDKGDLAENFPELMEKKKVSIELTQYIAPISQAPYKTSVKELVKAKIQEAEKLKDFTAKIYWSRAIEQICKISACLAEFDGKNIVIDKYAVNWAEEFITYLTTRAIKKCSDYIYTNQKNREHSELRAKILGSIKPNEKISQSTLYLRCRNYGDAKARNSIIKDLLDTEEFIYSYESIGSSQRKSHLYFRPKQ